MIPAAAFRASQPRSYFSLLARYSGVGSLQNV
jgi:hypothetical protein